MSAESENLGWGIIRYAPGSGSFPEDDAAGFDGWYADKTEAFAVAQDWARRFPDWIVALVYAHKGWDGDKDFSAVRHRALTTRERAIMNDKNP
jgi:hypothetical protein